jgi:aminoglycoside phosphotransferase (APT) family kinase protein
MTVLAFDPGVPQRDLLLDTPRLGMRLDGLLGAGQLPGIARVERVRVKYRVGRAIGLVLRVHAGRRAFLVSARSFTAGRGRRNYERALAGAAMPVAGLRQVAYAPELETVFWTFPGDRRIDSLALLDGPGPDLARLVGEWCTPVLAAYAPEKAATARCLDDSGRTIAYVKVYASTEGARAARTYAVHEALCASLGGASLPLRVPNPVAYDPRHRASAVEAIAGTPLVVDAAADRTPRLAGLGAALAALHGTPPPPGLPRFDRLDRERLAQAGEAIARVRPDVGTAARELADGLAGSRGPAGEPVCLHGDVHGKNAIAGGSQVALVDLDQASLGPAAADLGSALAALGYLRCTGALSRSTEAALVADLLAGYRSVRELPDPHALAWHTAAALLAERALRAVTRLRPQGLAVLSGLIACANQELERARG